MTQPDRAETRTNSHADIHTDVAIVGAGPIGIELHTMLKSAGLAVAHLEAGSLASTIAWWAPGTRFFSSPERIAIAGMPIPSVGQDKTTREDYIAYLRAVVQHHALPIRTHERVARASRTPEGFELTMRSAIDAYVRDRAVRAKNLVLAIGNMHAPRTLGIPGEELSCVSHYLADPNEYFGKRVLIVGGKNSAVEAAIRLYRAGAHVTIAYRRNEFDADRIKYWLLPELKWLIDKQHIGFVPGVVPTRIDPGRVILASAADPSQTEHIDLDMVLLLTGYVQDASLFEQLGVDLVGDEHRPHYNHDTMETNVPGLYVAGTACGGSQHRARVFIENSHVHCERIAAAVTGQQIAVAAPTFGAHEES